MKKQISFEDKINKLEEIVEILNEGSEPLDTLISKFEEGMELAEECRKYLENAEQKIIDITNKSQIANEDQDDPDQSI